MPAVLIEAGLSGLAAVATDVGAVREVIDHGETGYVVPVDDSEAMAAALAGLLKDDATRAAMGAAAAERCHERFTIARTASAWLGVLSGLEPDRT
jgi:glycosyltransferase involved in cell wall biosynthesis